MGQLKLTNGKSEVYGTVAYAPPEPWMINATLRENIVFGQLYNERRYQAVLRACGLNRDIESLSRGDQTQIGERGIVLSLGQRHRVSIARAAYSDADIILLDDALSGMDALTERKIFTDCVRGLLKDRAVVIVTNQERFLEQMDNVILLKSGICFEQGTYSELVAKDVDFTQLVGQDIAIEEPQAIEELMNEIDLSKMPEPGDAQFINQQTDEQDDQASTQQDDEDDGEPLSSSQERQSMPMIRFGELVRPSRKESGAANLLTAANEATISRLQAMNAHSIQRNNINEHTLSKYIEYKQLSVIDGHNPYSTMTQNTTSMARAIERNQLTIHSLHGIDMSSTNEPGQSQRTARKKLSKWQIYKIYMARGTGYTVAASIVGLFFAVHAVRIFIDFWLKMYVDDNETDSFRISLDYLLIYGILVVIFLAGVLARGYVYVLAVLKKSRLVHQRMLIVYDRILVKWCRKSSALP
jgi:ABC-type multidrug transport system ATPase subunit